MVAKKLYLMDCHLAGRKYHDADENETIANFLEMDWTDIFECRISKLNPDVHPENQVHLTIRIKRNVNIEKEA